MSERLEIRTLGGLHIQIGDQPVTGFDQAKAPALLVYLACTTHPYPREVLAEFLWERRAKADALRNLRGVIHNLRLTVEPYVVITDETLSINPASDWWLDLRDFDRRLTAARDQDVIALEEALKLYQGEFLSGFYPNSGAFENWADTQREWAKLRAVEGLDRLIACLIEHGHFSAGIARANQLMDIEPGREKTHVWLMQLHALLGNREEAGRQYERLMRDLQQRDPGARPSPQNEALCQQILDGSFAAPLTTPSPKPIITSSSRSAVWIKAVHEVPSRAKRLMGRQTLLADIQALLDQNEQVLLQGFSGIGKTALAAEVVAQWITAEKGSVLWLVAGQEPTLTLLEALARPFDAQQTVTAAQDEARFHAVRSLLGQHQIRLVVLDNVWDGRVLKQITYAIPPDIPVLLTSRHRFPVGRILPVETLDIHSALALLGYHAGQTYTLEDEAARQVCEVFGCHPFAIEIAGKTLQVDELTPRQLLDYIGDAPHLATMPNWFAEEGRESVKQLLDASLDALDPTTCEVFLAFGALFALKATPELIALCMDRDPGEIEEALRKLHRRGLAECEKCADEDGPTSFFVHDLAYSYARANAHLRPQEVVRACHSYIVGHLDRIAALDVEIDNLFGAARAAQPLGMNAELVDMMHLLAVKANYFDARGYSHAVFDILHAAIRAARSYDQKLAAHFLLSKLGTAYSLYLGLFPPAIDAYTEALELARDLDNHNRQAKMLTLLGTTRFRQSEGNPNEYYEQAYDLAIQWDDTDALAFILSHRAYYAAQKVPPDYVSCRRFADESVRLAERVGNHEVCFRSLLNRASAERDLGLFESALASDQEAYQMALTRCNRVWEGGSTHGIGEDYHAMGHREQAQDYFNRALRVYRQNEEINELRRLIEFMRQHGYDVPGDIEEDEPDETRH